MRNGNILRSSNSLALRGFTKAKEPLMSSAVNLGISDERPLMEASDVVEPKDLSHAVKADRGVRVSSKGKSPVQRKRFRCARMT